MQNNRTWWIDAQWQSMWICVRSNFNHWCQCFSIKTNANQYGSILLNRSTLIGFDLYWEALWIIVRDLNTHCPHWLPLQIDPSCRENGCPKNQRNIFDYHIPSQTGQQTPGIFLGCEHLTPHIADWQNTSPFSHRQVTHGSFSHTAPFSNVSPLSAMQPKRPINITRN